MNPLHEFARGNRCVHCGVHIALSGYSEPCPARRGQVLRGECDDEQVESPLPPLRPRTPRRNVYEDLQSPKHNFWWLVVLAPVVWIAGYLVANSDSPTPPEERNEVSKPVASRPVTSERTSASANPLFYSFATGREWTTATEAQKDEYCDRQAEAMQKYLPGVRGDFFKRNLNEFYSGVSDSILATPLSKMMGLIVAAQASQFR